MDELKVPVTVVEDHPWQPHQSGQIQVYLDDDEIEFRAACRADLTRQQLERFREWAGIAFAQVLASRDPAGNGWFPSAEGEGWWYMTAGRVDLPYL